MKLIRLTDDVRAGIAGGAIATVAGAGMLPFVTVRGSDLWIVLILGLVFFVLLLPIRLRGWLRTDTICLAPDNARRLSSARGMAGAIGAAVFYACLFSADTWLPVLTDVAAGESPVSRPSADGFRAVVLIEVGLFWSSVGLGEREILRHREREWNVQLHRKAWSGPRELYVIYPPGWTPHPGPYPRIIAQRSPDTSAWPAPTEPPMNLPPWDAPEQHTSPWHPPR